jgi:hypothetical protein
MSKSSLSIASLFIVVILITSCSPSIPQIAPSIEMDNSTATSIPTIAASFTETATSSDSRTPKMFATQFCMGIVAFWSCSCGDFSSDYIEIKRVHSTNECSVMMPKQYIIRFPDNWYCNVAGAGANNLLCVTAYGQDIFIKSVISELPLANADETISVLYEGDGAFSQPVVEPDEEKIEKGIVTVGERLVLKLLSKQDTLFILRYFIKENDDLYVLRVKANDLAEVKDMAVVVEKSIQSMQFIR